MKKRRARRLACSYPAEADAIRYLEPTIPSAPAARRSRRRSAISGATGAETVHLPHRHSAGEREGGPALAVRGLLAGDGPQGHLLDAVVEGAVRQTTAWYMLHRLRLACGDELEALGGTVEVDEAFLGQQARRQADASGRRLRRQAARARDARARRESRNAPGGAHGSGDDDRGHPRGRRNRLQRLHRRGLGVQPDHRPVLHGVRQPQHRGVRARHGHTNSIESVWAVLKAATTASTTAGAGSTPAPTWTSSSSGSTRAMSRSTPRTAWNRCSGIAARPSPTRSSRHDGTRTGSDLGAIKNSGDGRNSCVCARKQDAFALDKARNMMWGARRR